MLRPKRYALIMCAASLMTVVLAQSSLYRQFSLWIQDAVQELTAQGVRFEDVLVVDIDEATMAQLDRSVGAWPYPRSLYADVVDYLFERGARAVVFDMLLVERRAGDDELSRTLARHRNVWLAARGQEFSLARSADYYTQLQGHMWSVPPNVPVSQWQDMLLPKRALGLQAAVGVINVKPDDDGVLRGISLFHRAYGNTLPGMPVATLYESGVSPKVSLVGNMLSVGNYRWPLDDKGRVRIQIPRNRDFFAVLSFRDVFAAARAVPGEVDQAREIASGTVRGRTVYIGSSAAVLGDYAHLPIHGRTAGLGILALIHSALRNNLVLKPPHLGLDIALLALAAFLPLLYTNRRAFSELMISTWAGLGIGSALTVHAAAFGWYAQMSNVAPAILLGTMVWLVQLALRFRILYFERQLIWMEKLAADEANELKSRFLAHMTHELRTPLTAIIGYNNLLLEPQQTFAQRAQYVAVVQRNGAHLLTLINNLLDQAKIEAGQMSVDREPTRIRPLLEDFRNTLSALALEKNIELLLVCNQRVPDVLSIDGLRLTQILLNLTGNAIKFTERGEVRVEVDWQDGSLQIDVVDTGPGMDEQALARIFVAFSQADTTITRNHGGTGLGLTISRNLAQQMGGEITVRSLVGEGTVFTMRIDALQVEQRHPEPEPTNDEGAQASSKLVGNVVLVDDSLDIRELVALHLRRMGLTVSTADDGERGLEMVLRDNPDLVLMDVEMPGMNGQQATHALRQRGFKGVVLALTAHRDEALLQSLVKAGCDGVVNKPVTRDDLANAMRKYLFRESKSVVLTGSNKGLML
ncbi:MAG: signal transduction histidine kinase/ActR/RegA family two-component response regulator [Gammaproteobacteria bacterium]|jgi:signal transduction histidine kinase/ActR/RegA family two-component response regulator